MERVDLVASVLVQANVGVNDPIAEIEWLAEEASRVNRKVAIVGQADIFSSDFENALDNQMKTPQFRGVRIFCGWDEDLKWRQTDRQDLLWSPEFCRAMELLEKRDLSLDLVVRPPQLTELTSILKDMPNTNVVINHLATLHADNADEHRIWRDGIAAIAEFPNVYMKISGLWSIDRGWNPAAIRPPLEHVIDHLGIGRCMFGSNFPVEKVMLPFPTMFTMLRESLTMTDENWESLFFVTPRDFYRL